MIYTGSAAKVSFLVITALRTMQKVGNIRHVQIWNVKFSLAKRTLYSERSCDCHPNFSTPDSAPKSGTKNATPFESCFVAGLRIELRTSGL